MITVEVGLTLLSSTNFWADIVMNLKSAWWAITSDTNSLTSSLCPGRLFNLDREDSLSSRVRYADSIQELKELSSFLFEEKEFINIFFKSEILPFIISDMY